VGVSGFDITTEYTVPKFAAHFDRPMPTQQHITDVWNRLSQLGPRLEKNPLLAVVYMLHVETQLDQRIPQRPEQSLISNHRERSIKNFGNWVDCKCGCGCRWRFACGIYGMVRDANPESKCVPEMWMDANKSLK
jgi:hypothetical protein